jgi:outer membrane protein OmpA-like peptidoglycan-associated protein
MPLIYRFVLPFLFLLPSLGSAQNVPFDPLQFPDQKEEFDIAVDEYNEGDELFSKGPAFYRQALEKYMNAHGFNPNEARLNHQIGSIYSELGQLEKAVFFMERAMEFDPKFKPDAVYQRARLLHQQGEWDAAQSKYRQYLKLASVNLEFMTAEQRFDLESDRAVVNRYMMQCDNGKVLLADTMPVIVVNLGSRLNSPYPDYSVCVNGDESYMMFTSRRPSADKKKKGRGIQELFGNEDVYFSMKTKTGYWVPAQALSELNTRKHDATVWLSKDANTCIIYRFKNGGDLYLSTREDNTQKWGRPKPMRMLNSPHREAHASMTADGKTIYFTSNNSELGTASLDIYKVTQDSASGRWTQPVNLGGIINTEYDEEGVFISPDGKTLYFSSEGHPSMGGKDLFKTELSPEGKWGKPVNLGYPINSPGDDVFLSVLNGGDKMYIDSDRLKGLGEKDMYLVENMANKTIPYHFLVIDSVTGEQISSSIQVVGGEEQKEYKSFEQPDGYMTVLPVYKKFFVKITSLGYKSHIGEISTVYETAETIDFRDTIYMNLGEDVVTLAGTVYDAFTREKITGEIEISSEEHFAQLIQADQSGRFKTAISPEEVYTLKVSSEGYQTVVETAKIAESDAPEYIRDFYLNKLDFDKDYTLSKIYFDFDRASLRPTSIKELKDLKFLLERYPNIRIELSAHTDNVGSRSYNLVLSRRRAEAVVDWLVRNGIKKERLDPRGYAFDKSVVPNNTPANRQLNRRVEFKFLKD